MDIEFLRDYCLQKQHVTEETPFGPDALVMKVHNKMFCIFNISNFESINLKCDPDLVPDLRANYIAIEPGYHMNKRHWNTVILDGSVPKGELERMIDNSFNLVVEIDLNGSLTADNDFGSLVLFPNPIENQNVAIDMSAFVGESMTVGLYDISGKLLQQYLVPETHEATVLFDLPLLNSGVYHVIIGLDSTGEVVLRKLVKR